MKKYINWMNSQPKIIKIVLCIWILDISWAVYRIGGSAMKKDWVRMVLGILWVIAAGTIGWILDIIWIIIKGHIFWWVD